MAISAIWNPIRAIILDRFESFLDLKSGSWLVGWDVALRDWKERETRTDELSNNKCETKCHKRSFQWVWKFTLTTFWIVKDVIEGPSKKVIESEMHNNLPFLWNSKKSSISHYFPSYYRLSLYYLADYFLSINSYLLNTLMLNVHHWTKRSSYQFKIHNLVAARFIISCHIFWTDSEGYCCYSIENANFYSSLGIRICVGNFKISWNVQLFRTIIETCYFYTFFVSFQVLPIEEKTLDWVYCVFFTCS